MSIIKVLNHPIVSDKVRQLRSVATSNADFLRLANEITRFVGYEAFRDLPVTSTVVSTPVVPNAPALALDEEYLVVPILRAGLGMTPAIEELLPVHRLCLMGLRRNEETLQPEIYHDGLPKDLKGVPMVIVDPMLATGGSISAVVELARSRGVGPIKILCLIAAQPGVDALFAKHQGLEVYAAALDAELNEVGYITPGLGDAGDRLFGAPVRN